MQTPILTRALAAIRHQWLLVALILAAGTLAAVAFALGTHAKFTATTTVLMVAEPPESAKNPLVPSTATKPLLSTDLPSLATDATVLSRFRSDLGETASFETLRSRIRAKVSTDSTIMPVQFTATNPAAAIRGANLLGDEIVRFYRETATTRFDALIADYNTQLATRGTEITQLDGALASAAQAYPYIDVHTEGNNGPDSVYQRLIALRTERETLQATLQADAAAAQATQRLISDAKPLAERDIVDSDVAYRNVRDQYAKDYSQLRKINAFGSDRYPGIVELRRTVVREAASVADARNHAASAGPTSNPTYVAALDSQTKADALYLSDQAKLKAQDEQLAALHAQIGQGRLSTHVARLRRDHDNAESAYATIAARLAKAIADRAEAASTGSVIVLDRAQSAPKAAFAGGTVIAVGIMFLTLWLALTLAVMIDGSQEWFRDARTVETVYGTKLIGSLV